MRPRVDFPCLVKPRQSHLWAERIGGKLTVVHSLEEMRRSFDAARDADLEVVIQELIPGPGPSGRQPQRLPVTGRGARGVHGAQDPAGPAAVRAAARRAEHGRARGARAGAAAARGARLRGLRVHRVQVRRPRRDVQAARGQRTPQPVLAAVDPRRRELPVDLLPAHRQRRAAGRRGSALGPVLDRRVARALAEPHPGGGAMVRASASSSARGCASTCSRSSTVGPGAVPDGRPRHRARRGPGGDQALQERRRGSRGGSPTGRPGRRRGRARPSVRVGIVWSLLSFAGTRR